MSSRGKRNKWRGGGGRGGGAGGGEGRANDQDARSSSSSHRPYHGAGCSSNNSNSGYDRRAAAAAWEASTSSVQQPLQHLRLQPPQQQQQQYGRIVQGYNNQQQQMQHAQQGQWQQQQQYNQQRHHYHQQYNNQQGYGGKKNKKHWYRKNGGGGQREERVEGGEEEERGEGRGGERGKRKRRETEYYKNRKQQAEADRAAAAEPAAPAAGDDAAAAAGTRPEDDPDYLPGYVFDKKKQKYYKILEDSSGIEGYRQCDLAAEERRRREEEEEERMRKEREETERKRSKPVRDSPSSRPSPFHPSSTFALLSSLSLGCGGRGVGGSVASRIVQTARMKNEMEQRPSVKIDVSDFVPVDRYAGMESIVGCEFLDVSADGETLTGCWAVAGSSGERGASMALSVRVKMDEGRRRRREGEGRGEDGRARDSWLDFSSLQGAPVQVHANAIVDMAMAPTDAEVTCLLYATATNTLDRRGRAITACDIATRPICCRFTGQYDVSESPIYNIQTRLAGNVYSCGWSSKSMQIGVGMERYVEMLDVMSEQRTRVCTKAKQAISQEFDPSGNSLFLGLRYSNACRMDVRSQSTEPAAIIPESRNTCWMRLLEKGGGGNQIVLSTLEGKLSLYDVRRPVIPILSYEGHRSRGGLRLPTFVDSDEHFVIAVGADSVTRVWSLVSGVLLRELAAAATTPARPSDYPRPVYSPQWDGRPGRGALLIATGTHLNMYEMSAHDFDL